MSRLKIPRPSKWVLVRTARSGQLFVLERKWFNELRAKGMHMEAELVAGSNDRNELVEFQKLTEES